MKRIRNFLEDESGVMVSTEALFLYPFTIFIIFWLIYMGLYMFQGVALQNYAQKVAVVAAREISYPGYMNLAEGGDPVSIFGTNAIDWETDVKIEVKKATVYPYRYLTSIGKDKILDDAQLKSLQGVASSIVTENSMLVSDGPIRIDVDTENYFISQQVDITITETLPTPGVFSWFRETSKLSATASATANDPDEYVRNTDLVFDFLDILCKKLDISDGISGAIEKVKSVIEGIGNIGLT